MLKILNAIPFAITLVVVGIILNILTPSWTALETIIDEAGRTQEVDVTRINSGLLIGGLLFIYWLTSFRFLDPVQSDEIAVKTFFGKPFGEVGSGPAFAPWGIVGLVKLKINFNQREFPTEPEKVWRPDKNQMESTPPEGFKPPVRITFGESVDDDTARKLLGSVIGQKDANGNTKTEEDDFADPDSYYNWCPPPKDSEDKPRRYTFIADGAVSGEEKDGLNRRVTAEVSFVLRWRIIKGMGTHFVVNIGSVDNLVKQAEDEMVGILQRLLPNMSVGQALQNIGLINSILKYKVESRTENWGVEIADAFLKQIMFHRDFNSAIADRGEAFYQAAAEKERITRKGEADGSAAGNLELAVLEARAQGYEKIAVQIDVSGAEAQAAEVARVVGAGQGTIIVGADGISQLMGIGKALLPKQTSDKKGDEQ